MRSTAKDDPIRIGSMPGLRDALRDFADAWITNLKPPGKPWREPPRCDWCKAKFETAADLEAYVDFCMHLGKLWDPKKKRLPEPKVFCTDCAPGAISELIDGLTYVVGRDRLQEARA